MIYLREITRGDLEFINAWRRDATLTASLCGPHRYTNLETDERWFENYLQQRETAIRLMICLKGKTTPIGRVDLLDLHPINRSAEFQILIADPQQRGHGYGHAATTECLRHAFLDRNLHRIYLSVLTDNVQAIRLYRSCHFLEEGVRRAAVYKNGQYWDVMNMAILAPEFITHQKTKS